MSLPSSFQGLTSFQHHCLKDAFPAGSNCSSSVSPSLTLIFVPALASISKYLSSPPKNQLSGKRGLSCLVYGWQTGSGCQALSQAPTAWEWTDFSRFPPDTGLNPLFAFTRTVQLVPWPGSNRAKFPVVLQSKRPSPPPRE